MDILGFFVLIVTGFTACVEFGSYAFVHPVLWNLPPTHRIRVEQGLLKTVGRAMPALMPLASLLALAYALWGPQLGSTVATLRWAAVLTVLASVVTTLIVNVPINSATARWNADQPPPDWEGQRRRWEVFQSLRAWLLLAAFVLLSLALAWG